MELVAKGISEALITTETGLVIALPGLFFQYQLAPQARALQGLPGPPRDGLHAEPLQEAAVDRAAACDPRRSINSRRASMGRFRESDSDDGNEVGIDMSPLIDCVFILLIFFIVTTIFVEETGVEVDKPQAASAVQLEKNSILIALTEQGRGRLRRARDRHQRRAAAGEAHAPEGRRSRSSSRPTRWRSPGCWCASSTRPSSPAPRRSASPPVKPRADVVRSCRSGSIASILTLFLHSLLGGGRRVRADAAVLPRAAAHPGHQQAAAART